MIFDLANDKVKQHILQAEFGLERESLRVTVDGTLAQTKHPFPGHRNIDRDFCENQIEIINNDIKEYYKNIETETFDVITCNPPFFKFSEQSHLNESTHKQIARHEIALNLEEIIKISKKLLKNKGNLAMVHRPERLIEIITIMKNNNIEPKRICFIHPKEDKEANILLIEGVKNGKPGIKILPPIFSHNNDGSYTKQIEQFFS